MIRVTSTPRLKAFSHSINAIFHSKGFPPRLADYKAPAFIHTPKTSLHPFSLGVHKALKELHASEIVCTKYEHYVKVLTPKALCHTYPSWLPNSRWDLPSKRTFLLCSYRKFPQVRKAYFQKEQMKQTNRWSAAPSIPWARSLCPAFHVDTFSACLFV